MDWTRTYLKGKIIPGNGFFLGIYSRMVAVFGRAYTPEEEAIYGVDGVRISDVASISHYRTSAYARARFREITKSLISGVRFLMDGHGPVFVTLTFDMTPRPYHSGYLDYRLIRVYGTDFKLISEFDYHWSWHQHPVVKLGNMTHHLILAENVREMAPRGGYTESVVIQGHSWPNNQGVILGQRGD